MRRSTLGSALAASRPASVCASGVPARADDVPGRSSSAWCSTPGASRTAPAEPDLVRFQIHGEEQLRVEGLRSFPLDVTWTRANAVAASSPNSAVSDSLGQNAFLSHWLRITPIAADHRQAHDHRPGRPHRRARGRPGSRQLARPTPRDSYDGYNNLQPRWLYLEWLTPVGLLRAGQQGNHWGMGIVANDGDHPSLFGDYRYGNITEQILFATKPLGIDSPFVVALAGNVVYRDNFAILTNGDVAWQGILAAFYEQGPDMLGLYGVYRHQTHDRSSEPNAPYTEFLDVGVIDVAGHFARPIELPRLDRVRVRQHRGRDGARQHEHRAHPRRTATRQSGRTEGPPRRASSSRASRTCKRTGSRASARTCGDASSPRSRPGYASGDANPYDGVEKRFVFDPNHKVGLLLFDEVMRWQTARASAAAQDCGLLNCQRPFPGANLLPSNGGVFGAEYLYPTFDLSTAFVDRPQARLGHRADDGRLRRLLPRREGRLVRELPGRQLRSGTTSASSSTAGSRRA